MPSSPNRRRVEIPAALYDELAARAAREGTTVAAVAARLLAGALDEGASAASSLAGLREDVRSLTLLLRSTLPLQPVAFPRDGIDPRLARRARRDLLADLRRERDDRDDRDDREEERGES